jgi:hypothetical protein
MSTHACDRVVVLGVLTTRDVARLARKSDVRLS